MKKILGYIVGLITMLAVFAMVYIAAAIYDTSGKVVIEPYFMRFGFNSGDIVDSPRPLSEMRHRRLRDWLVQKFVVEYLYIVPDRENIEARTGGRYAPLRWMASSDVFNKWVHDIAPEMSEMAKKGVRRSVTVFDEVLRYEEGDYYRVDYEMKTWYKPNDMAAAPVTTRGTMYLEIGPDDYSGELRTPVDRVRRALSGGMDPAIAFVFRVRNVIDERTEK